MQEKLKLPLDRCNCRVVPGDSDAVKEDIWTTALSYPMLDHMHGNT
jgi:hypothetical protein